MWLRDETTLPSNQEKREYSFHCVDGHVPLPFPALHIVTQIHASLTACDATENKRRESSLPFPLSINSAEIHLIWTKGGVNIRDRLFRFSPCILFHASLTH